MTAQVMKLWLISQDVNTEYDTYDSAVVVAADEESARRVHPSQFSCWVGDEVHLKHSDGRTRKEHSNDWAALGAIKVELIGSAEPHLAEGAVVCASFNAG